MAKENKEKCQAEKYGNRLVGKADLAVVTGDWLGHLRIKAERS